MIPNDINSFRTKNKLECYKKVCENKDFCGIAIYILKFKQYMKPDITFKK